MNIDASAFSAGYSQARSRFLEASREAGASVEHHHHVLSGPDAGELATDVAVMGPSDARSVLVLCSGTHGVEGFAGSGIQTGLLREGLVAGQYSGVRVVFIHAINPFGFAYRRRVNEDNVDLNRNFVDHDSPHPRNEDYESLAEVIAPTSLGLPARLVGFVRIGTFRATRGDRALQRAVSAGQYSHPAGLFFGGTQPVWSNLTLRAIVSRHLSDAARVAFIDLHTGLGPHGHGEMIVGETSRSAAYRRARRWWGERVRTVKDGSSVSVDMPGVMTVALKEILPHAELTAGSLEFGTIPAVRVFRALQVENWLHHHGDGTTASQAEHIRAQLQRAFYPESDGWKAKVYQQARAVVAQALAGLGDRVVG